MGKTNWTRMFLGGLVAGIVLNVFYFAINAYGGVYQFGTILIASRFITGMLAMWLYSAIRPRYGAGPKTAIIAGIALYVLSGLLPAISSMDIKYRTKDVVIKGIILLVMYVAATLAGAWVYKEQE